jgi:hypothetical protein
VVARNILLVGTIFFVPCIHTSVCGINHNRLGQTANPSWSNMQVSEFLRTYPKTPGVFALRYGRRYLIDHGADVAGRLVGLVGRSSRLRSAIRDGDASIVLIAEVKDYWPRANQFVRCCRWGSQVWGEAMVNGNVRKDGRK